MNKLLKCLVITIFSPILVFLILRQVNTSSLMFDQLVMIAILHISLVLLAKKMLRISREELIIYILTIVIVTQVEQFTFLNIDRSRSYYVLSWVENNKLSYDDDGILISKIASYEGLNSASTEYRLDEQISRKLVRKNGNELSLTLVGKAIYHMSNVLSKIYMLKGWEANKL